MAEFEVVDIPAKCRRGRWVPLYAALIALPEGKSIRLGRIHSVGILQMLGFASLDTEFTTECCRMGSTSGWRSWMPDIDRTAVWGLETQQEVTLRNAAAGSARPAQVLTIHGIWPGIQRPIGMSAEGGRLPSRNSVATSCPSTVNLNPELTRRRDDSGIVKGGCIQSALNAGDTTGPDRSTVLGAGGDTAGMIVGGSRCTCGSQIAMSSCANRERRPAPTSLRGGEPRSVPPTIGMVGGPHLTRAMTSPTSLRAQQGVPIKARYPGQGDYCACARFSLPARAGGLAL